MTTPEEVTRMPALRSLTLLEAFALTVADALPGVPVTIEPPLAEGI